MGCNFPPKRSFQYLSTRRGTNRSRLEHLFGSRLSYLNIEDEYNYNLSYLVSQNISGTKWASTLGIESKSPVSRTKLDCIDSRNESSRLRDLQTSNVKKLPQFTSEKPTKQVADEKTISKSQKLKTSIAFTGMLNKSTPVLPTVASAAVKEQEKNKCVRQKSFRTESSKADRLQQPRKSVTTNHQPSESQFPGLHIYVTDSPQRPYYDMMSAYEPPTSLFSRKTVASDPIILNISNGSKHKRSVTHNTYQNEPGFKSNFQTPPDTPSAVDHSHIPTVASRIEKFTALIKNNDDTLFVNLSRARSPYRDNENSVQSQDEPSAERSRVQLQRSATYTAVRSHGGVGDQTVEYCFTCCKRVYPVDRVSTGERVYHKACFRCATCHRIVLPGTFASLDGIILCKPHYIEQFRRRGRYELRNSMIKCDDSEPSVASIISIDE
ncbi:hypothetical protein EG68_03899 [Paragonimus skrjabini miyazakii]|uniref:LIM zinc-binding domain-containing protein n=1 Tax=Paragonimus skrjabini miyazakii TaxID=59628 RepID=A0A8S9YZI6_9TREM|nr:hypothetical protein EG68_03899 [Paragonimus skrjabini miyazakii]